MPQATLRPNGAGTAQHAAVGDTPQWKCVDEVTSDGDVTYLANSNDGLTILVDRHNLHDVATVLGSNPAGTISKVEVFVLARTAQQGTIQSCRITVRKGVTNLFGPSIDLTGVGSYTTLTRDFGTMTLAEVNSLTAGLETTVQGDGLGNQAEVRWTQAWVVVTFNEAFAPDTALVPIVAQQPSFVGVAGVTEEILLEGTADSGRTISIEAKCDRDVNVTAESGRAVSVEAESGTIVPLTSDSGRTVSLSAEVE